MTIRFVVTFLAQNLMVMTNFGTHNTHKYRKKKGKGTKIMDLLCDRIVIFKTISPLIGSSIAVRGAKMKTKNASQALQHAKKRKTDWLFTSLSKR